MKKSKGLVILHLDGLGYDDLLKALRQGHLPFVASLIENEGYQVLRYRCGLPSTTRYCQAGIIYGTNDEIPGFRWWDKESGVSVTFGGLSSFPRVEHKYFSQREPLTREGAAIATCYPDSTRAHFGLAYRERRHSHPEHRFSQRHVFRIWLTNPIHLLDWVRRGLWEIAKANMQLWGAWLRGQPIAQKYVLGSMLEEILLHHLTRFALLQAMHEKYPVIYAGLYAYDETSHAFGPKADYSSHILHHLDNTIRRIAHERGQQRTHGRDYELVVLSDHGQIETVPFESRYKKPFREIVARWPPTYEIQELNGDKMPSRKSIDGHIVLAFSGALAHLYFRDISWRLRYGEIKERFPGLIEQAARTPGIAFVLAREGHRNVITTRDSVIKFKSRAPLTKAARRWFERYDEPEIVARQLDKVNSFARSGDLIFFAKHAGSLQINFENQRGGHGSIGGEQSFPFILAKRDWNFSTTKITDVTGIYALLKRLCDRLI